MHDPEKPSKSALKREHKAVQAFVQDLIDASDQHLGQLPLSPYIVEEIQRARKMKMGARKRQVGFISKRMVDEPVQAAMALLEQLRRPSTRANDMFHYIETVRDRLIGGDDSACNELVERFGADERQLRYLVNTAREERSKERPPRSARQLFRFIRSLVESSSEVKETNKG